MRTRDKKKRLEEMTRAVDALTYDPPLAVLVFDLETVRESFQENTGERFTNRLKHQINRGFLLLGAFRGVLMAGTDEERAEVQAKLIKIWSKHMGGNHVAARSDDYFRANQEICDELVRLGLLPAWSIERPRRCYYWLPSYDRR